ncbi:UDP-sugar pyrophosphorylase-like [Durio zibethinus]|uniref:UDP-sugar pyrophosphorylase-like n=1 Tax=Durio zibethinus TaxID=66656 RepID=A0A6P6B5L2_DURZI|nr:UDP-sugar pyrophosphorylase-like [Durio zibethinus]
MPATMTSARFSGRDSLQPQPRRRNLYLLSPDQIALTKMLLEMGQSHLFQHWSGPGVEDNQKKAFFHSGGFASDVKTARELLADSKAGKNPYDGFPPSVPIGEILSFGDDNFIKFEEAGIKEAQIAAFVLVAGGLGAGLGYNGIKENVACLDDNDAKLALDPHNKYKIEAIPEPLRVSATKQYHVNSLATQQKAKEVIGGITRLIHSDGRSTVINVEHNHLDPLLRASGHPDGDELGPYIEELTKTGGAIKEFVNPK